MPVLECSLDDFQDFCLPGSDHADKDSIVMVPEIGAERLVRIDRGDCPWVLGGKDRQSAESGRT